MLNLTEWLDPHHLIPDGRYFHDLVQSFVRNGYTVNYNLKAATYDWRYSPSELKKSGYFQQLKNMTEQMVEKFHKKVVYAVHSMGNPVLTYFLTNLEDDLGIDQHWKDKHIKHWAAISPVFMGSPLSLKSLISGELEGLPRFLVSALQMRKLSRTFPSSYFLVPSIPKEYPESWPDEFKTIVTTDSKNYTFDNMAEIFDDMQTDGYRNVTDRFLKWRSERQVVKDPGVPIHIFYGSKVVFLLFASSDYF